MLHKLYVWYIPTLLCSIFADLWYRRNLSVSSVMRRVWCKLVGQASKALEHPLYDLSSRVSPCVSTQVCERCDLFQASESRHVVVLCKHEKDNYKFRLHLEVYFYSVHTKIVVQVLHRPDVYGHFLAMSVQNFSFALSVLEG